MKKIICFCLLILSFNLVFAQNNSNELMLDPESALYLQDVPIKEGVDEFSAKLAKIRKEEKREPLGLVLCGGSARAFCHIGALRAMEENDIVPDFIVANSMGAIIGMLYAYGFSPDKIQEIISSINLSSYFEPVIPLKGGLLSVRNYEGLINQLLGEESHDVKDCEIPILILSEDVYTKRQIWHAEGDFSKIMCAAFAMSAFMEPVNYTLKDGTEVKLLDSGAIDIAGLKIAESFSSNLIVSTAFYDKDVNFNSMIVILNRTMSIGKERVAISDIKQFKPVLLRNDVEHFSFMDFQKMEEIAAAGYKSAYEVMDTLKNCPHGKKDLSEIRKKTDELGDAQIYRVKKGEPVKISENYFGLKVWPIFPVVDFPDFFLYEDIGISAYAFLDFKNAFIRAGANYPVGKNEFSADALLRINPSMVFDFTLFGSYAFSFDKCKPLGLYSAFSLSSTPGFFPYCLKSVFITGEIQNDEKMLIPDIIFTGGLKFQVESGNGTYLYVKPYAFASGYDYDPFSFGVGTELMSSLNIKYLGFGEYASVRYAFSNIDSSCPAQTKLCKSDFYRGNYETVYNNLIASSSSEICYVNSDPDLTFAEFLILQEIKFGGFFDYAYDSKSNYSAGAFLRGDLSLVGLCSFVLEGGCGWDFTNTKFFGYFNMKNKM